MEPVDSSQQQDVRITGHKVILESDLVLSSSSRRLFVDVDAPDRVVLDGQGKYSVVFSTLEAETPFIFLARGKV